MRKLSLLVIAVAFMLTAIAPSTASAQGACGGGNTINALVHGWQRLGVADDAIALTGNHVGVDGSAIGLAHSGFEWAIVVQSGWSANYTCIGGHFKFVGMAWHSKGDRVLIPKKGAPKPGGKAKWVNAHFPPNCGNKRGRIKVRVPAHKKHKKAKKCKCAKPKPPSCEAQGLVTVAGNCVTQQQSARMACEAKGSGYNWDQNTNQCQQIQVVCGNVVIISGDNNTVDQGGNCNTQPPPCSCPPPPCTNNCTPAPPTMEVKNVTTPQEVYDDGETYPNVCADVTAPNGDSITLVFSVVNPSDHTQSGIGTMVGQRTFTFTSQGFDHICGATYQAPNTLDANGRQEQIEATAHDNSNTSVANASGFSQPFTIMNRPPNPV